MWLLLVSASAVVAVEEASCPTVSSSCSGDFRSCVAEAEEEVIETHTHGAALLQVGGRVGRINADLSQDEENTNPGNDVNVAMLDANIRARDANIRLRKEIMEAESQKLWYQLRVQQAMKKHAQVQRETEKLRAGMLELKSAGEMAQSFFAKAT